MGATAARDLEQGQEISARSLAPHLLAERGQFVVVTVAQGNIEIRLLARAQESGGFGQVIRATNEQTGQTMHITLTGAQRGVMTPEGP